GGDVARVEYRIGAMAQFALASPFFVDVVLPSGASSVTVTAIAVDTVGNRSDPPFTRPIAIDIDQPPTVTLINPSGVTSVRQGDTLAFTVSATDDGGLS